VILWYVPILNRLPRDHRFTLGERMVHGLYEVLELLIQAQYVSRKVGLLQAANPKIAMLRYHSRLLLEGIAPGVLLKSPDLLRRAW